MPIHETTAAADVQAPILVDDGLDPLEAQMWHARQDAPEHHAPYRHGIPTHPTGQDLSGGHQAVHYTAIVIPPGPGAPLFGSAVQQLLGRDYDRLEVKVQAIDGPLILSSSKEIAETAYAIAQLAPYVSGQTTGLQSNPAPGANFSFTNTTGQPISLTAFTATFTADATVANRFPGYQIQDASGNVLAAAVDGTAVVAAGSVNIRGYQGATQQNSGSGNVTLPLPSGITIPAGGKFITTGASGAADQWSAIVLTLSQNPGQVPNYAGPGSWLQQDTERSIRSCDELYATLAGNSPVHVSIIVSRRLGIESPDLTRA